MYSSVDKNTTDGFSDSSGTTNQFVVSLVTNVIVTLICLLLFSFLRPHLKRVYSPRLLLLDMMFPLGKIPNSCFAWVMPAFMANDDDVFYYAGIDALVYLRFMKLCLKISFMILPYGIAVLLPLNFYGGQKLGELEKLSMSNISQGSPKLWAHLLGIWVYSLVICYFLLEEWKVFTVYRQEFLAKGYHHQYVVLVRDLPAKLQDEESMKNYVEELFPGQVEDVSIAFDLERWERLLKKHDSLVWKLEHNRAVGTKSGRQPKHRTCRHFNLVDAISYYETKLKVLQDKLEDEIQRDREGFPCAFVVFRHLKTASVAAQVLWDNSSLKIDVQQAPEVRDVIWKHLSLSLFHRKVRKILVYTAVFFLVFFWFGPVSFVSSLIALNNLAKEFSFLKPVLKLSAWVKGLIEGFLSSVIFWIFFAILPWILQKLTKLEGIVSQSKIDMSVIGKLFVFTVINRFLFMATAGAALNQIQAMIKTPAEIPNYLAMTLPAQSVFFMNYLILSAFIIQSLELLRIFPLIVITIKRKWFCLTQREDEACWRPPSVYYDVLYSNHLFFLMVGLSYSILAPIITPFVVFYFGFGYVVWTYQILCVYIPKYNAGGLMWPVVFTRVIVALVVFQLLMIGVLGLKDRPIISVLVLPLPVITVLFYWFIQNYYAKSSCALSLSTAATLAEASPRLLQEIVQSYVRKNALPSLYGLSTDTEQTVNQLQYETIEDEGEQASAILSLENRDIIV